MSILVKYRPSGLAYENFLQMTQLCFPKKSYSKELFNEMLSNHYWIAFNGDILVGYIAVDEKRHTFCISDIDIIPEYRRKGIDIKLLQSAIHCAILNKKKRLVLRVETDNVFAIKIYDLCKFKVTDVLISQFIIPVKSIINDKSYEKIPNIQAIVTKQTGKNDNLPRRYHIAFVIGHVHYGRCCLEPDIAECSDFFVSQPGNFFIPAILALKKFLNPKYDTLILAIDHPRLKSYCLEMKYEVDRELVVMECVL